jgi:hypothetical protein
MTSRLKVIAEEQQNMRRCAVRDAFSRRDEVITRTAAYDWSKKKLSATLEHPWLDASPYHVQLLLLEGIKGSEKLAVKWKQS